MGGASPLTPTTILAPFGEGVTANPAERVAATPPIAPNRPAPLAMRNTENENARPRRTGPTGGCVVGLFSRKRGGMSGSEAREVEREAAEHFAQWMSTRHGIEIFTEPKTTMQQPTMMLVAHDGEFTRRPIRSPEDAEKFAREHALPIYDATVVGYPQRMRDYSRRQTLQQRRDRSG
jgi:hypothetical protein